MQLTGFVNAENINIAGCWSLGLLQMDFFYRQRPWYAGQFVRKVIPKMEIPNKAIPFITTILNQQKKTLLSVLVRNVDKTFNALTVHLPTKDNHIDFDFMESFIAELETQRIAKLEAYLSSSGLKDYTLTKEEETALENFGNLQWGEFTFKSIFNKIKQGRRLKTDDQISGTIPFVMSGITNAGVVNYISNPVASFPKNSITIDIFGNTFYRDYAFGAGDDTGVYWNDEIVYSKEEMLFFAATMAKALSGKFSFGKKLRSSQSLDLKMSLPIKEGQIDFEYISILISAIQKLIIKDVVLYTDKKVN